jgi:hypothetical protein
MRESVRFAGDSQYLIESTNKQQSTMLGAVTK